MAGDQLKLAEKVASKAEDVLFPLKIAMASEKWPNDLRKIMWQAIADTAAAYANEK